MLSLRDLIFSQETPSQSQSSFQAQPPTQNQLQQSSSQSHSLTQSQSQQKSQSSFQSQPFTQSQSQRRTQSQSQTLTQSQSQPKRSISQPHSSSSSQSLTLSQSQSQQKRLTLRESISQSIPQPHSTSNISRRASFSAGAQPGYDSDDYADLTNQVQNKDTNKAKRKGSKYLNDTPLLYKGKHHIITFTFVCIYDYMYINTLVYMYSYFRIICIPVYSKFGMRNVCIILGSSIHQYS
jgi:Ca2+-dependent lipid-binding protein